MSILGKIVGQLESSSLGDYIILPSYNSNTKITDFTLPENSVFKIEKGFDEEKQIYNWLSINSTEVSLTVNNITPTEEGVSDGNRTIYMIKDNKSPTLSPDVGFQYSRLAANGTIGRSKFPKMNHLLMYCAKFSITFSNPDSLIFCCQ